jgi:hypothetical protein
MMLDTIMRCRWTQHEDYHSLQPMQKQKYQFRNHIPTATPIFYYEDEGFDMPPDPVPQTSYQAHQAMARGRGKNSALHGPQQAHNQWAPGKSTCGHGRSRPIKLHTGMSPGATFFWGSRPIDGLWVSKDLDISNACVMPFGFGVGDHRAFILGIPLESLVGANPVTSQPASQQPPTKMRQGVY